MLCLILLKVKKVTMGRIMREGCLQRIFREDLSRKFRVEKIESRNWGRNSRRIARERSNGVTVTVSGPVSGPDCRPPY